MIVGDGSDPIEDAVFVVDGDRFAAVGAAGEVEVPEGAARVDLSGRTVIPTLLDTHVHLSVDREARIEDLRQRAYYGVSMAVSLGHDEGEAAFDLREEEIPGVARSMTAGAGDHPAGAGAVRGALLGGHRGRGPGGGPGAGRTAGGHREDLGGRPERAVPQDDPPSSTARSSTRPTSTGSG